MPEKARVGIRNTQHAHTSQSSTSSCRSTVMVPDHRDGGKSEKFRYRTSCDGNNGGAGAPPPQKREETKQKHEGRWVGGTKRETRPTRIDLLAIN